MSAPVKTTEPAEIRAGDTATWLISLPDYPAGDWSLAYTLINASGKIEFASAAEGDAHKVHVPATETADWAPGAYAWQCRAVMGDDAFTVRTGTVTVLPDFSAATTLDARSHAEKTLAALEAWIEGRSLAVAEYEIAGRKMKYIPIPELLKLRDAYRREVRGQQGKSGRVFVRF